MWLFKNKKFLGVICLILALIATYFMAQMTKSDLETTTVVKVNSIVLEDQEITKDMLKTDTVSVYNLPSNVIKDKNQLIGKYSKSIIYPADYLTLEKFQDKAQIQDVFLLSTNENRKAVSVTVKSLAAGLSGKIVPGDIVTVKCYIPSKSMDSDVGYFMDFPRLQYVEVAAVNNSKAEDTDKLKNKDEKDKNGTETIIPATITFLVTDQQAEDLIAIENIGNLHVVFAGRGESAHTLLEHNSTAAAISTKQEPLNKQENVTEPSVNKANNEHLPENNSNNSEPTKKQGAGKSKGKSSNETVFDPNKGFEIK